MTTGKVKVFVQDKRRDLQEDASDVAYFGTSATKHFHRLQSLRIAMKIAIPDYKTIDLTGAALTAPDLHTTCVLACKLL